MGRGEAFILLFVKPADESEQLEPSLTLEHMTGSCGMSIFLLSSLHKTGVLKIHFSSKSYLSVYNF